MQYCLTLRSQRRDDKYGKDWLLEKIIASIEAVCWSGNSSDRAILETGLSFSKSIVSTDYELGIF